MRIWRAYLRYGTPLAYRPSADTAHMSGYVLPLAVGKQSAHTPSLRGYF